MTFEADQHLSNIDPHRLAAEAVASNAGKAWVISTLGYVLRHNRESAGVIEETGALICRQAGVRELRRIAEDAEQQTEGVVGQALCLRLLSGYWRLPDRSPVHGQG